MGHVRIRIMEQQDFEFAVRLTDMAEWGFTVEEFAWMKSLEPGGCFVAVVDDKRAGLATTINYGSIGWIGNVIVHPRFRAQGVGSELVQAGIDHLQASGAGLIGLYSYVETAPFYERLGFTGDLKFTRFSADIRENRSAELPRMAEEHLPEAVALDERCFGARRERLLKAVYGEVSNRSVCYVAADSSRLFGFIMGRVTEPSVELGPLICPPGAETAAEQLLTAALSGLGGRRVYLGVSQRSPRLYRSLRRMSFRADFRVLRMWLGGESPKAEEDSYRLMESLERG
ncbi:MAG: GNAT family N-acetyltransferase [Candidatus Bathyarchaeia archaeon]